MSVRPSAWNNNLSQGTDFRAIWHLIIFRKSANKIQVLLKSEKNNGHFTFLIAQFFLE